MVPDSICLTPPEPVMMLDRVRTLVRLKARTPLSVTVPVPRAPERPRVSPPPSWTVVLAPMTIWS